MQCPFKVNKILKDRYGSKLYGKELPAVIETDFGECDGSNCMAYDRATCGCLMVKGGVKCPN